jgi:hypothetical protein
MKRMIALLGLIVALGASSAAAQSRIGISVTFGDPYIAGHVVIGRPHYHRYAHARFHRYHPRPIVIVAPRVYRPAPVVVVRPHRHHPRRSHRR